MKIDGLQNQPQFNPLDKNTISMKLDYPHKNLLSIKSLNNAWSTT